MNNEKELKELFDEIEAEENNTKIRFKCKPTWNFQSIEFDYIASESEIDKVIDLYRRVLEKLSEISPEQEKVSKKRAPSQPLATQKQKDIMRHYGISFSEDTTMAEAQELIKESIANSVL